MASPRASMQPTNCRVYSALHREIQVGCTCLRGMRGVIGRDYQFRKKNPAQWSGGEEGSPIVLIGHVRTRPFYLVRRFGACASIDDKRVTCFACAKITPARGWASGGQ